ncbi:MAG: 50S ribosomal protein L19 [Clostridia bacterium]|nr:50S ribosomal protein L19 [Clostridia bacterium]
MDIIKSIEHEQLKSKVPVLNVGDTVKVHVRIKEGNRERIQVFEGIIIKKQGGGLNETFTVRRISYGVGVEKTFLLHAPSTEKVEVVRVGKARRAKLYYLRDRVGKAAKTKEKVGARIETKEISLKEEVVPGESEPVEEPEEVLAETPVTENVEEVKEVAPVVEEKAEVKEEPKAEETPVEATTEAPAEEEKKADNE